MMLCKMCMFQEKSGGLISIYSVSVGQHGDDYIRPNANLAMKPQIRSKEQLRHMYPECELKDFEYHIELDPKFKSKSTNST